MLQVKQDYSQISMRFKMKKFINSKKSNKNQLVNLLKNNRGVAIIEMAIILPILLIIVFGVIEFGNYYLKSYSVSRAQAFIVGMFNTLPNPLVSRCDNNPATSYQAYTCPGELNGELAQRLALNPDTGLGVASFDIKDYTCGKAFNTYSAALAYSQGIAATGCNAYDDGITTSRLDLLAGFGGLPAWAKDVYYIGYAITPPYQSTYLTSLIPGFKMPDHIVVSGVITAGFVNNPQNLPTSTCPPWSPLNYNPTTSSFFCDSNLIPIPPNCTDSSKFLQWGGVGVGFTCATIPSSSNLTAASCKSGALSGLKWNGSSYDCVWLGSSALTNSGEGWCQLNNGQGGWVQFVQFDGTNYTCSAMPYGAQGAQGAQGPQGQPGTPASGWEDWVNINGNGTGGGLGNQDWFSICYEYKVYGGWFDSYGGFIPGWGVANGFYVTQGGSSNQSPSILMLWPGLGIPSFDKGTLWEGSSPGVTPYISFGVYPNYQVLAIWRHRLDGFACSQ